VRGRRLVLVVVLLGTTACSGSGTGALDGIPVVRGATRPAGTPLGDGFEVVTGSVLVGGVFPSFRAGLRPGDADEGWRALLLVTGDVDRVLDAYTTQARRVGLFPQVRCDASAPALLTCAGDDGTDARSIDLRLQRGDPGRGRPPLSHLFIRYRRTGPSPRREEAVPADGTYGVPRELRDVPEGWRALPRSGRQYEDRLVVPDGARLIAPPGAPWPGSVAVFEVTGDPPAVVEAAVPRGSVRRVSRRSQQGAEIATVYGSDVSPYGTVIGEVVERRGRTPLLLVEHDATD
jgi:hypothetical protein